MTRRRRPVAWRLALWLLPGRFRERHRDEMEAALDVHLEGRGPLGRTWIWTRAVADTVRCAARLRRGARGGERETGGETMSAVWHDLTFAARALARRPGFTVVAVLTLAVGVGANATIFSVVNGVLLQPLPYRDAERIGILWHEFGNGAQNLPAVHPLDVYDYRDRSDLLEDVVLASGREWILGGDDAPELVDVGTVEAGFFDFFGVTPELGRAFSAEEDRPGGPFTVMLSHRLWSGRYGSDPAIVGRSIEVAGGSAEVVGVLPASFRLALPAEAFLLRDAELWTVARVDPARLPPRNFTGFTAFARLRPGATFAQAQEEIEAMAAQLRREHPVHASSSLRARIEPLQGDVVKGARRTLMLLFGAVGFVLLIACANVANLVMVRGQARAAELSLRAALGAGRGRLVRLVLAESAWLAGVGAALGMALAYGSVALLSRYASGSVPRMDEVGIDGTVLLFAAGVGVLSAALFGVGPALRAAARDPGSVLQAEVRGGAGARARGRDLLIVAEVALSLVLLVGTGLMVRSFVALGSVDPGYAVENVLTFRLNLPLPRFPSPEEREVFHQELTQALGALPGVRNVSSVSQLPLTGSGPLLPYAYDAETASRWESVTADQRSIRPGFFEAMGAKLLAGREFTAEDVGPGAGIVVDDRLAQIAFGSVEAAVGSLLQIAPNEVPEEFRYATVLGVVDHLRLHDLGRDHLTQMWFPMVGAPRFSVAVRTDGDAAALAPAVRALVAERAPGAPLEDVRTMEDLVSTALAPTRLALALMTGFGAVALLLACVGIYGVLSYAVSQRTREIGVRMALGQSPHEVRASILGGGMRLVGAAAVVGLVAATALSGVLSGLLFDVPAVDPWTYAGTTVVLVSVAAVACWIPARRATRVDPASALRDG